VKRKQFSSRIEKSFEQELQFIGMGTAWAQTLYAGKRPNLIRIYNKLAEWRMQLRKLEIQFRRFNKGIEDLEMTEEQRYYGRRIAPSFEEYCRARGYQLQRDSILTRIERQFVGGSIPPELATLNDLRHAHEFHPFAELQIIGTEPAQNFDSPPPNVSVRNWLAAIGLENVKEQLGSAQLARSVVFKHANGNGKRLLESLAGCCPMKRQPITIQEIQESFQKSTLTQTQHSG
jgi:hypothetical protein